MSAKIEKFKRRLRHHFADEDDIDVIAKWLEELDERVNKMEEEKEMKEHFVDLREDIEKVKERIKKLEERENMRKE